MRILLRLTYAMILGCSVSLVACQNEPSGNPFDSQYPPEQQEIVEELREHGVQVILVGDTLKMVLGVDYFFFPQSATQLRPDRVKTLKYVARLLKCYGNVRVTILGHTDNVGTDREKFIRSKQQAHTIAAYLWSQGIPLANMRWIGCGDTRPVASNQIVDGSAANRRIEILVRY